MRIPSDVYELAPGQTLFIFSEVLRKHIRVCKSLASDYYILQLYCTIDKIPDFILDYIRENQHTSDTVLFVVTSELLPLILASLQCQKSA